MSTLTYWLCPVKGDHPCYNLREETRKAAIQRRQEYGVETYGEPRKVTVTYRGALDLLRQCLWEGGAYWEDVPYEEQESWEGDDDDT